MRTLLRRRIMSAGGPDITPVQIVNNGNFADWPNENTFPTGYTSAGHFGSTYRDVYKTSAGGLGFTAIVDDSSIQRFRNSNGSGFIAGHIYFALLYYRGNKTIRIGGSAGNAYRFSIDANIDGGVTSLLYTASRDVADGQIQFQYTGGAAVGDYGELRNVNIIDLTATFGAGNEPTLEECRRIFTKDYYPYNPITI